jgi:hypothetical protein
MIEERFWARVGKLEGQGALGHLSQIPERRNLNPNNIYYIYLFFVFGGLECVGHSFAYAAH